MRVPFRPWGSRSVASPQGRTRKTDPGPGGRGQAEAAPVHRAVSAADPRGGGALYAARRGGSAASPRGVVQLPSDGLAQGAAPEGVDIDVLDVAAVSCGRGDGADALAGEQLGGDVLGVRFERRGSMFQKLGGRTDVSRIRVVRFDTEQTSTITASPQCTSRLASGRPAVCRKRSPTPSILSDPDPVRRRSPRRTEPVPCRFSKHAPSASPHTFPRGPRNGSPRACARRCRCTMDESLGETRAVARPQHWGNSAVFWLDLGSLREGRRDQRRTAAASTFSAGNPQRWAATAPAAPSLLAATGGAW